MKRIKAPFFEFGPKAYLYGKEMLELAKYADELTVQYGVDIIITPQSVDIRMLASACRNLHVFAQHIDVIPIGRGMGRALPEAVKEAGAQGTMLNHAERRLNLQEIEQGMLRCRDIGLMTMVCADSPEQAAAVALFSPDIIVAESPTLIEGGNRTKDDESAIIRTNEIIKSVNKDVLVLHGAGIHSAEDVYEIIAAGAGATGSTSAIIKAKDPREMLHDMIKAVREAWDKRH